MPRPPIPGLSLVFLCALSLFACRTPPQNDLLALTPSPDQGGSAKLVAESGGAPPKGCRANVLVAKYAGSTTEMLPQSTRAYDLRWLYEPEDISTLQRMAASPSGVKSDDAQSAPQLDPALVEEMKRTYVLVKKDGAVTADDVRKLGESDFREIEFDCPVAVMASPDEPSRGVASGQARRDAASKHWFEVRTGASVVVPAITRRMQGRTDLPVRVAVVDSGVDANGLELPDRVLKAGASFVEGDTGWLSDPLGHGTAVASILQRFAGPFAEIVSIKVLDAQGRGSQSALARGILSAVVDHRAQVINLSLGYHRAEGAGGLPQYLIEALAAAYGSGARVFAAAGNACRGPERECQEFYPAAAPWVVDPYTLAVTSVSGLAMDGRPSSQVVTRPADIWAPSEFICGRTSPAARRGGYQLESGSSFAVPQVAGAFALFMAYEQNRLKRALTFPEVERLHGLLIMESARDGLELSPPAPSQARATGVAPVRGDCPTASHEGAFLRGKSGGRLNLCAIAVAMGMSFDGCVAWSKRPLEAGLETCPVERPSGRSLAATFKDRDLAPVSCCGYPASAGYERIEGSPGSDLAPSAEDQRRPAVWCSSEVHSAPSIPICTSCQYCLMSSTQFRLTLQLNSSAANYTRYHLRLTTRAGLHLYFPLGDLSGQAGGNLNYDGGFEPPISPPEISEAWLIATDRDNLVWTGSMLQRTTCN